MSETKALKKNEMNMVEGSLADKLILFALPLAATAVLQQLFNAADIAVVGRFASSDAMAAVGSNASVIGLVVNLFIGLSVGANVVIANLIGSGHREKINEALHTVILVAFFAGLVLLIIGISIAQPILVLMGAPENVMNYALLYLRIYFLGMPSMMLYNFGAAVLRSKGDSKRPLFALALAGVVNIFLNLLLVAVFHLHVIGVAVATVTSNTISAALVLSFLWREEEEFQLRFHKLKIRPNYLKQIFFIGMPAGVQGMVFSLSNVVIQSCINSFGSDAIAGSTAGQNFEFISYCVVNAFAQTSVTFMSQNYGAGNKERCKKVFRLSMLFGFGFDVILVVLFIAFRYPLMRLFTVDEAVTEYAMIRVMHVCLFHYLTGTYEISGGCIRGLNHSLVPALTSIFGTCVFRMFWVFGVVSRYNDFGILMNVYPISWVLTGTIMITLYFIIRKKAFALLK